MQFNDYGLREFDKNVQLLFISGSHAYGTNHKNSDLDIRGFALNDANDILLGKDFGYYTSKETDTVIKSFNRQIELLSSGSVNELELFGLKKEHYLYVGEIGKLILDNENLFLSKLAVRTFIGYANSLIGRIGMDIQSELEYFDCSKYYLSDKFGVIAEKSNLYENNGEIYLDMNIHGYTIDKCIEYFRGIEALHGKYKKLSKNRRYVNTNKTMMNTIRVLVTGIELMETGKVNTYRSKERDLLKSILSGDFQNEDGSPADRFTDLVNDNLKKFKYACNNTVLPDKPNKEGIEELRLQVNKKIVMGEL